MDLASPRDLAPVERYEQELPWSVERPKLEARRVYRTPSPGRDNDNPLGDGEFEPGRLVPFYQYSGSVETGTEGGRVDLIGTHVPAVTDPELVPEIEIDATVKDGTVRARAAVEGGQPPYKLEWGAEAMATIPSTDDGEPAEISVELAPREPIEQTTVQASVVDANGATASATRTVEATVEGRQSSVGAPMGAVGGTAGGRALGASVADADPPSAATDSLRPGNFDFGFESANWNVSNDNGKGFVKQMRKGPLSERFTLWGRWCWERDYRDPPGPTARDEDWGDNADFQYYVGHGNPKLFTFKDSSHEKGYFPYWNGDRDWGDYDAEWLALYSCSVLKPDLDKNHPQGPCGACDGKDVFERWGNNFDGLHILLGFQHLAWTWVGNPTFSNQFGRRLRQGMPIWKAWIHTIRNHGPNSDDPDGMVGRGRVIAPYTEQCVTGVYDKIWSNGYVAPDIPPGDIAGWCDIRGG